MRLSGLFVAVSAAVGSVVWFLSGLLIFAVSWRSSTWGPVAALVLPPTVPVATWQQLSPWNLLLPVLAALLFGGLLGLALRTLSIWHGWQVAAPGIRFLSAWFAAIVVAFVTAAVWALGATIAHSSPVGFAWAFRSSGPDLLASGYFGLVWGWTPALVLVLFASRSRSPVPGRSWSTWVIAAVAVLSIGVAVGVVVAQPTLARAARIAAGGTPNGLPATTPAPTPTPAGPPTPVASNPVQPAADWCDPENTVLTVSGTQGELGHRALTLVLVNQSSAPCVVDGYPDVAFADDAGNALDVDVQHGSSYTAADPGATAITLAPGTSVQAQLGWAASGAGRNTATTLWTAEYPGAQRSQLPTSSDITDGSTVTATAWSLPASAG